jgi:hypothetical protein
MRYYSFKKIPLKYFLIISISFIFSLLGLIYNYNYDVMLIPFSVVGLFLLGLLIYKRRSLLFGIIASIQFVLLTFASYFYFSQTGYDYEAYSLLLILILQVGVMPFVWNRFFLRGLILNSLITFISYDLIASLVSLQFALENGGQHYQYFWISFVASVIISYMITTMRNKNLKRKPDSIENNNNETLLKVYFGDKKYRVSYGMAFLEGVKVAVLLNNAESHVGTEGLNKLQGYTIITPSDEEIIKIIKVKDTLKPDIAPIEILSIPKDKIYSFINEL